MVILHGREAVVYSREFAREGVNFLHWFDPRVGWSRRVQDPASCSIVQLVALVHCPRRCVGWGEEEEHVPVCDCEVEDNLTIVGFEAIDRMALERYIYLVDLSTLRSHGLTVVGAKPTNFLGPSSASGNESIPLIFVGVPCPVVPALCQSRRIALQRRHWKHDPVRADSTVMDDAAEWSFVPAFLCL